MTLPYPGSILSEDRPLALGLKLVVRGRARDEIIQPPPDALGVPEGEDRKANREAGPHRELRRQRPVRPMIQDEEARRSDQHRGRVVQIDRPDVVALLGLERQTAVRAAFVQGEPAREHLPAAATRTAQPQTAPRHAERPAQPRAAGWRIAGGHTNDTTGGAGRPIRRILRFSAGVQVYQSRRCTLRLEKRRGGEEKDGAEAGCHATRRLVEGSASV